MKYSFLYLNIYLILPDVPFQYEGSVTENCASITIRQVENIDCGEYRLLLSNNCGDVSIDITLKILGLFTEFYILKSVSWSFVRWDFTLLLIFWYLYTGLYTLSDYLGLVSCVLHPEVVFWVFYTEFNTLKLIFWDLYTGFYTI